MRIDIEKLVDQITKNKEIKVLIDEINALLGDKKELMDRLLYMMAANFYLVNIDNYEQFRDNFELQKVKESLNFVLKNKDGFQELIEEVKVHEDDRKVLEETGMEEILDLKRKKI